MSFHRVFLAIKLPEPFIASLAQYQASLDSSLFKIEKPEQLHLTLIFLGSLQDKDIDLVQNIVSNLTKDLKPLKVKFTNITYGPNTYNPRLIWAQGEPNKFLETLKRDIEADLENKINFSPENRPLLPHITLARVKTNNYHYLPPQSKINTSLFFEFIPQSLWLVESQLKTTGAEYTDLKEFYFKKN
ncbi:MAG: RNA 2',3'-cyclic phosphodiesterase [Minisyncoccia bacterium]